MISRSGSCTANWWEPLQENMVTVTELPDGDSASVIWCLKSANSSLNLRDLGMGTPRPPHCR